MLAVKTDATTTSEQLRPCSVTPDQFARGDASCFVRDRSDYTGVDGQFAVFMAVLARREGLVGVKWKVATRDRQCQFSVTSLVFSPRKETRGMLFCTSCSGDLRSDSLRLWATIKIRTSFESKWEWKTEYGERVGALFNH